MGNWCLVCFLFECGVCCELVDGILVLLVVVVIEDDDLVGV